MTAVIDSRLAGLTGNNSSDYFIVTELDELDLQADLKTFLSRRYPVLEQSEDYVIFDMKGQG